MLQETNLVFNQLKAIEHLYEHDETLLIAPKGFGKCVVGFTTIKELTDDGILGRVLVLSTAQVCRETWAKECDKWAHLLDVSAVCLTGEDEEKRLELLSLKNAVPLLIANVISSTVTLGPPSNKTFCPSIKS